MKVLMLLDNPGTNDRRVQREAETLAAAGYDITLVCVKGKNLAEEEYRNGVKILRWFDSESLFDVKNINYAPRMAKRLAEAFNPQVLHTHDREMLHLARYFLQIRPTVKYIHDIHEMHFSFPVITNSTSLLVRIKSWLVHQLRIMREKRDSKVIDHFITVSSSLEEKLRQYFGLKRKGKVIRNIPESIPRPEKNDVIRLHFGISKETRILVFIGANIYPKVLNLEQVIDELTNEPKVALVFICADNENKKMVQAYANRKGAKNIFFHPLLKPADIPVYLASCDVGLVPTWNKKNLSYWYALDNKLFEYLMSEIPILATAQPEYKKMVESHGIGICVNPDEPGAYRQGLLEILKKYENIRPALAKAKKELNWDRESQVLLGLYMDIYKEVSH